MLLSTARELHLATLFYCGREKDGVQPFEDEEKSSRYSHCVIALFRMAGRWALGFRNVGISSKRRLFCRKLALKWGTLSRGEAYNFVPRAGRWE